MTQHLPPQHLPPLSDAALSLPFRVTALSPRKPTRFDIVATPAQRAALAQELGLSKVESLTFKGEIRPVGKHDYAVIGELAARVVQPCSVTLAPVRTDISEAVHRTFLADFVVPDGDEVELQADETIDPLPEVIDAGHVATEALVLAIPLYPRAPGAELGTAAFAEPGVTALKDGDLKPFAGLADLKARLAGTQKAGEADTGKPDTGKPDTGKPDTGKADTGEADTGAADTGAADTGGDDSAGGGGQA